MTSVLVVAEHKGRVVALRCFWLSRDTSLCHSLTAVSTSAQSMYIVFYSQNICVSRPIR
jgi:hypothetical protein